MGKGRTAEGMGLMPLVCFVLHAFALVCRTSFSPSRRSIIASFLFRAIFVFGGLLLQTAAAAPLINVWYGEDQTFGPHVPQPFINILGNVSDPVGVVWLSYSLNGGPSIKLSIGADGRRLEAPGDFNADIPISLLAAGRNEVRITARNGAGEQAEAAVNAVYLPSTNAHPSLNINWGAVGNVQDVAFAVDGCWKVENGGVRCEPFAYDRVLAFGEQSWLDYDLVVPIAIHEVSSDGAVGLMARWNGHTDKPLAGWQPKSGWIPLGTLAWWQNNTLLAHRYGGEIGTVVPKELQLNVFYIWRLRVESVAGDQVRYCVRVWPEGTPEPSTWDLWLVEPPMAPRGGSPALITYRADATFGNVQVLPLTADPGIRSDDFNAPSLNASLWTFTNPLDDAAVSVEGAYSGDAHAIITVPGGALHDVWGLNQAPRIMQKAVNADFEVEAKFDSPLTRQYHIQGILIEQDAGNSLRFDFHCDGAGTRIFAAKHVDGRPSAVLNRPIGPIGMAPLRMRVKRQGGTWTQSYSTDGTTWTTGAVFSHGLRVGFAGVFAGNAGSPAPAFTGRIDYFFLTSAPISPEDGYQPQPLTIASAVATPGKTSAVIAWTTNKPASSSVRWGTTTAYDGGTLTEPGLVVQHSVALQNLTPGRLYHCEITSRDSLGLTAVSLLEFQTLPDSPSGIISDDFNAPSLNGSTWTFIDPRNDAAAWTEGANTGDAYAIITMPAGREHDVWSGNQAPRIMQKANNTDFEIEAKFDSPLVKQYQTQGILIEQDAGNFVRFDFHCDGKNTRVFAATFANGKPTVLLNRLIGAPSIVPLYLRVKRVGATFMQSYSMDGAAWTTGAGIVRAMAVSSAGAWAGNAGSAPPAFSARIDYFFLTSAPIVPEDGQQPFAISGVTAVPEQTAATITWTTNGPASTSARWGVTSAYETGATADGTLVTSHAVVLPDLAPGTAYHCEITSQDAGGASASSVLEFSTLPGDPPDIMSDSFDASALDDALWTFVNPLNDALVSMRVTSAQEACVAIDVPAGADHDIWSPANRAPRIMQAVPDGDFEIEVKFSSPLLREYQIQGIIVEQDASNFIRFDFHSSGKATNAFVSTFAALTPKVLLHRNIGANGAAPLYMRVKRAGAAWTHTYSFDGSIWLTGATFSHSLNVTAIGICAGNAGGAAAPPQFTMLADYFGRVSR